VLDVSMPGRDGLTLQEALVERGSELPVLFLTAHGDVPRSVRAMKRGAVDFLTKPVDDEVLLEAVRGALRADRERREGREDRGRVATASRH
jgi:FixJ family two-component response regulator